MKAKLSHMRHTTFSSLVIQARPLRIAVVNKSLVCMSIHKTFHQERCGSEIESIVLKKPGHYLYKMIETEASAIIEQI